MPQSLSGLGKKIHISIANSTDSPSKHRPQLALAAMNIVAEWSILESFMTGLYVQMVGENPRPAVLVYADLSDLYKRTAIRAVARGALNPQETDVLEAILSAHRTAAKHRNKVAHWIWGYSKDLPDAVLLLDPNARAEIAIAHGEYRSDQQLYWRDFVFAVELGMKDSLRPFPKAPERLPLDGVYVFTERDFKEASNLIQRVMHLIVQFTFVVNRNHPANADGSVFSKLLAEPEIRTYLENLDRQRTAQATQGQPPPEQPKG